MTKKDLLLKELESLPEEAIEKILDYVKEIKEEGKEKIKRKPRGWLNQFKGIMTESIDGLEMQRKIREEWED